MIDLPIVDATTDETRPWRLGDCSACPLGPPKQVRGYGKGGGIAIVGESPGTNEIERGQPFIGPSGRLIREVLRQCGVDPEEVYWTNALLCHSREAPPNAAVVACNGRLHEELADVGAKKVLLLGKSALQAAVQPSRAISIQKNRGKGMMLQLGYKPTYALATYHPAAILRSTDYFLDLARDVYKFVTHEAPIEPPPLHVYVSWTPEKAVARLNALMNASVLSCDIETTGFSVTADMIVSIGFGVQRLDGEVEAQIFPAPILEHPDVWRAMLRALNEHDGTLVLHNGKFDLRFIQMLYNTEIKPRKWADTMLMSYVLDERSSSLHGLKALAGFHFDAENYAFDFDAFFDNPEPKTRDDYNKLFYYQGLDCAYTLQLYHILRARMDEEAATTGFRGDHLLETLLYPASLAFKDVENHGVLLDRHYLVKWGQDLQDKAAEMRADLTRLVTTTTPMRVFNPASPRDVRTLLYDTWHMPEYKRSNFKSKQWKQEWGPTNRTVLYHLAEETKDPTQAEILKGIVAWRQATKLSGTYAKGLLRHCGSDSRVRPFFFLHGTVTGRPSCTSPNLQNIPNQIGPQVEYAFMAPEGWSMISADFSQLELRVLAAFSRDPELIGTFMRGEDIHEAVGRRVFQVDKVSYIQRKLVKTLVFGVLYGRGPESIALGHEMRYMVRELGLTAWTKKEAHAFQQKLLHSFPGLKDYIEGVQRQAKLQHYVEAPTGRRRRFPFITPENQDEVFRQAVNSPIQGTASDICLDALLRLHAALPEGKAYALLTIHDAIILECANDVLEDVIALTTQVMQDVRILDTDIPFKVALKVGPRWGEVTEVEKANAVLAERLREVEAV